MQQTQTKELITRLEMKSSQQEQKSQQQGTRISK